MYQAHDQYGIEHTIGCSSLAVLDVEIIPILAKPGTCYGGCTEILSTKTAGEGPEFCGMSVVPACGVRNENYMSSCLLWVLLHTGFLNNEQ